MLIAAMFNSRGFIQREVHPSSGTSIVSYRRQLLCAGARKFLLGAEWEAYTLASCDSVTCLQLHGPGLAEIPLQVVIHTQPESIRPRRSDMPKHLVGNLKGPSLG